MTDMKKTFRIHKLEGITFQMLGLPSANYYRLEIESQMGSDIEEHMFNKNDKNIYGLAHFIEHLGFRAPKDFTTTELLDTIQREGTYNANTSFERVRYFFKTTMENRAVAPRLVTNYALNDLTKIGKKEFETERQVVFNEAKRYADDDQSAFYMGAPGLAGGRNVEDTIIGTPETISTFSITDAISTKRMMLDNANYVVNITYDPTMASEIELIEEVLVEWRRHNVSATAPTLDIDARSPKVGQYVMENNADQLLTQIYIPVSDWSDASSRGDHYLSSYSSSSLNEIIREQNGLTYGIGFYNDRIEGNDYVSFHCDVTRGTEDKLMSLLKSSIQTSVDNFSMPIWNEMDRKGRMSMTMDLLNLENYNRLFNRSVLYGFDNDLFETDVYAALFDDMTTKMTYEQTRDYIQAANKSIQNEDWAIITN